MNDGQVSVFGVSTKPRLAVDSSKSCSGSMVCNTYRGFVEGFRRFQLPRGFVGLESIRGPQFSFRPFSLDTLDRFWAWYPIHCGLPDYRLYPPGDYSCADKLVANIFRDIHR
jgi:hypothetical protein